MTAKYYIAYGSNLNISQMKQRCPTAVLLGAGMLEGWQLEFRGLATISEEEGGRVPVALWRIDDRSEAALDRYEGTPSLYRREYLEVGYNGEKVDALVYIKNYGRLSPPSEYYYFIIEQGYSDNGLDTAFLRRALERSQEEET